MKYFLAYELNGDLVRISHDDMLDVLCNHIKPHEVTELDDITLTDDSLVLSVNLDGTLSFVYHGFGESIDEFLTRFGLTRNILTVDGLTDIKHVGSLLNTAEIELLTITLGKNSTLNDNGDLILNIDSLTEKTTPMYTWLLQLIHSPRNFFSVEYRNGFFEENIEFKPVVLTLNNEHLSIRNK